jgi:hypothetical protein
MSTIFPEYFEKIEQQRKIEAEWIKNSGAESDLREQTLNNWLQRYAIRSTVHLYALWLIGYKAKGGKPTHYYDRCMNDDNLYLLTLSPVTPLPPGYGSSSIGLLVPVQHSLPGRDVKRTDHNNIYFFDTFERPGWVPVFSNT